ncbi:hypothetical protein [Nocardia sp. NPDC052112]|uniref:hypothetical protein n=1 Tax=Nocardia sp. NPDC052112 TaxID=3155646 RepID=UPI003427E9F3
MRIQLLGGPTNNTGSPRLWIDEDRHLYLVQGYRVAHDANRVEIPHMLLGWLQPGTYIGAPLVDSGHGSFTLAGQPITDPDALAHMQIPDHEIAVAVPVGQSRWEW